MKIKLSFGRIVMSAICCASLLASCTSSSESNESISGADENHDGVRDDVEQIIRAHFQESESLQMAVRQHAKALQKALTNPEKALEIEPELTRAIRCQFSIKPDLDPDDGKIVESAMVNTLERVKRYIKFNGALSGRVIGNHPVTDSGCDFEPSAYGN